MHVIACLLWASVSPSATQGSYYLAGRVVVKITGHNAFRGLSFVPGMQEVLTTRLQLLATGWPWRDLHESLTISKVMPCWYSLVKPRLSCPREKQLSGNSRPAVWSICPCTNSKFGSPLKQLCSVSGASQYVAVALLIGVTGSLVEHHMWFWQWSAWGFEVSLPHTLLNGSLVYAMCISWECFWL